MDMDERATTTHRETSASQAVLGLELLHVLQAVVDEAEPRALAATVVGPEAEERHRRRVRHTELLLPERKKKNAGETRGGKRWCRA